MPTPLIVSEVFKDTMYLCDGIELPVVRDVNILRFRRRVRHTQRSVWHQQKLDPEMLYGNYAIDSRQIREILHCTIGYVSQFLRTVPRVTAIDIVAEPLFTRKVAAAEVRKQAARQYYTRLHHRLCDSASQRAEPLRWMPLTGT